MGEIYALYSARNGAVRYIGQTCRDRHSRFREHKRELAKPVGCWIDGEWRAGYPVECVRLQPCSNAELDDIEAEWIGKFPGLLNELRNIYPSRWPACIRPRAPRIPEIAKYIRGHLFNVDGHRGVHYQIGLDRYFVMIYSPHRRGSEPFWLGDELPGDGALGFSDFTTAVKAKDEFWERHKEYIRRENERFERLCSLQAERIGAA
jgi:hypothetical protein